MTLRSLIILSIAIFAIPLTSVAEHPKLAKARTRYDDKKDYPSASILLKQVLDDKKASKADRETAEFFMGKTLYMLNYYAASLSFFNKIVEAGPSHRFHSTTLKWLAALSRKLPETAGILEKIGTYKESQLEVDGLAKVRDELYYLLGKHYYSQGNEASFAKAISLFQRVNKEHPVFVRAKFFEAVTFVRQNKAKPALNSFKEILILSDDRQKYVSAWARTDKQINGKAKSDAYYNKEITRVTNLTIHQLGRVFYTARKYDMAIRFFEEIPKSSENWADALFESSWAYFMRTNNSKALGNIHTLNAPYFESRFFPESMLLKSVIHYKYCQYDQALETIKDYNTKYKPLEKKMRAKLAQYEDNADFFDYVQRLRAGTAKEDPETERIVLSVLVDASLEKAIAWVDELDAEIEQHSKADPAWKGTEVGNMVAQELNLAQSFAKDDAGQQARDRVSALAKELKGFSRQGKRIMVEVLGRQAGDSPIDESQILKAGKDEKIKVDDEHFVWEFNGEYWKDELGYYRVRIKSECGKQGGGAAATPATPEPELEPEPALEPEPGAAPAAGGEDEVELDIRK